MTVKDQIGNNVHIPETSGDLRLVSIVPSQTELLYDLGAKVIAQTVFCVHPREKFKPATKIGGTKNLKLDKILELQPDLVIGNKEENDQAQIKELSKHVPVWMSDIYNMEDALSMILSLGEITGREEKARNMAKTISADFASLKSRNHNRGSAAYLIWNKPTMLAGRKTFINTLLEYAGFTNIIIDEQSRYPEVSAQQLIDLNPRNVLLSSEPFPFKQKHVEYYQSLLPDAKIALVDGEFFSWYGSRLTQFKGYLETLTTL